MIMSSAWWPRIAPRILVAALANLNLPELSYDDVLVWLSYVPVLNGCRWALSRSWSESAGVPSSPQQEVGPGPTAATVSQLGKLL